MSAVTKEGTQLFNQIRHYDFWIRREMPKKAIKTQFKEQGSEGIVPNPFYTPRVFIWAPLIAFQRILLKCPQCQNTLTGGGWSTDARRCYDLADNCYIVAQRLNCRSCGHRPVSHNQTILCQLDEWMVELFPFILTECSAITKDLMDSIIIEVENGVTISKVVKMLKSKYTLKFNTSMLRYYSLVATEFKRLFKKLPVTMFSTFADPLGYYGRVPSGLST